MGENLGMSNHFFLVRVFAMLLALSLVTWAQGNKKPYTEWSEKESLKLLNDSPWGQTQTFTDTSRSASTTRSGTGQTTAIAETVNVRFRIRFMSAKPVRQAISRVMEIQRQGELPESVAKQLKAFAAAEFPDYDHHCKLRGRQCQQYAPAGEQLAVKVEHRRVSRTTHTF